MKAKLLLACLTCAGFSPAQARELPTPGGDYYSLQIASSKDAQVLQQHYLRYTELPFVRVERRGALYVLRAGFWDSQRAAELAVAQARVGARLIRVAAFRPETIVQRNWRDESAQVAAPVAPPAPTHPSAPLPAALALAPSPRKEANAAPGGPVLRPFNQEDFVLAYDVLLGSRDLEGAFQLAQHAVQQVPKDNTWRRKLAQVAEWTQRPAVAAEQWRALFAQGDHAPDTVAFVIRLAASLDDPSIALQAWVVRAQQTTLTSAQWQAIFDLYETMAEPVKGSRFFEAEFAKRKLPVLLEYAARLAENAGEDERAEVLYAQRGPLEPFSMDAVLRAVVSLIRRDHLREALALLQSHEGHIAADATEFWRLLSQVAWELRDYDAAQSAYQRYAQTPQATTADWSRLVFLVRQQHPAQAAGLALEAYRRFDALDQLVLGLGIYAEMGDSNALERVFKSLDAQALAQAEQEVRFLQIRAQFYQRQKMPDLAWADWRLARQRNPDDPDVILASLWFLIDEARTADLSVALKQFASRAHANPAYWLAYAAANQALNRPREAVIWYTKEVRRHADDPLLLLNYADALERSQRVGMAERIRRHAWLRLKQKYQQPVNLHNLGKNPELLALARLAIVNQTGDPARQLVRHLTGQMRAAPPSEQADDGQVTALVLGWAVVKEQFANARAWMWLRYARQSQSAPPLWGDSQVALQLIETQTMGRLLASHAPGLPIYNRYDTAYALGHVQQALDIGFKGMDQPGGDEALHDRFRQHAPLHANYLQLKMSNESLGALTKTTRSTQTTISNGTLTTLTHQTVLQGSVERQGVQWEARWVPNPKLQLLLGGTRMRQFSDNDEFKNKLPDTDRIDSLEVRWLGPRGDSSLAIFQRQAQESYTGLRLKQTLQWGGRINLEAGLDYRADSALSPALQVGGYENSLHTSVNYTLGKRNYLRIAPRVSQYHIQNGDYLGSGHILDLEAGYRIRTEYPDWRVRAFSTHQHFFPSDPVSTAMPESSSTFGTCLGMGDNLGGQSLQAVYSRAWRPFFDVCVSHNSAGSESLNGSLGLAGSLTGEDHLSVQWQGSEGQVSGTSLSRAFAIRYRHYF